MAKAKKAVAKAPKKEKVTDVVIKNTKTEFVAFRVRAVIPTQAYGNIQPEIEVKAPTYEEARDFALPHIEALYKHYAETKPMFLGKIEETVRVVVPAKAGADIKKDELVKYDEAPQADVAVEKGEAVVSKPKSEPVLKAEKAISLAMTEEAALIIQDQIVKSVKIAEEDKQPLLSLVLKKRGELAKKK